MLNDVCCCCTIALADNYLHAAELKPMQRDQERWGQQDQESP